jgi:dCTP diphosphatase
MAKNISRKRVVSKNTNLNIGKMTKYQRAFAKARNWEQFHTPKNLSVALSVEVSELLELIQWKSETEVLAMLSKRNERTRIEEEVADVLHYLLRLSDILEIDLEKAFWSKARKNAKKYPVRRARGNSKKWSEL